MAEVREARTVQHDEADSFQEGQQGAAGDGARDGARSPRHTNEVSKEEQGQAEEQEPKLKVRKSQLTVREMVAIMKLRSKPGTLRTAGEGQKVPESRSTSTKDSIVDTTSKGEGNPPIPNQSLEELSSKFGVQVEKIMRANESLGSSPEFSISIEDYTVTSRRSKLERMRLKSRPWT